MDLIPATITCPYCGETLHISIDPSEYEEYGTSSYIEDCQVCCQPITIRLSLDQDGNWLIQGLTGNDPL